MNRFLYSVLFALVASHPLIAGCYQLHDSLQSNHSGWTADFADYPVGEEEFYELSWGWGSLPNPHTIECEAGATHRVSKGLFLGGNNHSDDLFMFAKKQLRLEPNSLYELHVQVDLETDTAPGTFGIGGSPGESIYFKIGASIEEPRKVIKNNYHRMNIDKGEQSAGGADAVVAGTLANPAVDANNPSFQPMTLEADLTVRTDSTGSTWLFMGSDSGFEGATRFYVSGVTVSGDILDHASSADLQIFEPVWTEQKKSEAVQLLKQLHTVFSKHEIDYCIFYGTVLGHLRHNKKIIPWDDDLDTLITEKDEDKFLALQQELHGLGIGIGQFYGGHRVFWLKNPQTLHVEGSPYSWPFVDIFVGKELNATICCKNSDGVEEQFTKNGIVIQSHQPFNGGRTQEFYSWDLIRPFEEVQFEGITVMAPRLSSELLHEIYGSNAVTHAIAPGWNHQDERVTGYSQVPVPLEIVQMAYERRGWTW